MRRFLDLLGWRPTRPAERPTGGDERPAVLGARDAAHLAWLEAAAAALGPDHAVHASADALVLSALDRRATEATLRYIATARRRVSRVLAPLARLPDGERSVVILFATPEAYYAHVSAFQPDGGTYALSGGMFIDADCPHFATVAGDLSVLEPVIAHELTHAALAHLALPLWLDEGLAVNTERRVATVPPPQHTPQALDALHRRFWGPAEVQQFWTGASFQRQDDGNLLSYDLARLLVSHLSVPGWADFATFVADADRADAGAGAARRHLGVHLGAAVAALVGRPDTEAAHWAPAAADPA